MFYSDNLENLYYRLNQEQGFMFRLSDKTHHDGTTIGDFYSAFTVAELGEMLPRLCSTYKDKSHGVWHCDNLNEIYIGDTEADARAKMLCYLLENKLVTVLALP